MDDALRVICEIHQSIWRMLKNALDGLSDDEIGWRPLPQANNISLIVRHLRIEAQWHLDCLEHGAMMPTDGTPALQEAIDSIPFDFQRNIEDLEAIYARFVERLRETSLEGLAQRTAEAYGEKSKALDAAYLLGYHQATHLAMHCGQIRMIRNLYRTTRGEPALFFAENPTFAR